MLLRRFLSMACLTLLCSVAFAGSAQAECLLIGDVDGDLDVDSTDALKTAQHAEGSYTVQCVAQADVDSYGGINEYDAVMISHYVVGNIDRWVCHSGAGLLGDANRDGEVTMVDALLVAQYDDGQGPVLCLRFSDTNCDGHVNGEDADLIADYTVGLIDCFCCSN
jgi:hypothetical protein